MGGLVLDVIIALLIKSGLRLRRAWGSGKWPLVQARVDSSSLGGGYVFDCPTVYVGYTYDFDGKTYSGIDSKPFYFDWSAKKRVERFCQGGVAVARVNPMQPERSVLMEADQPN